MGECGSCTLFDVDYETQLHEKQGRLSTLLAPFGGDAIEVFDSPSGYYRARAEFRIWHDGGKIAYAMGNSTKNGAVTIEMCPKVIEPIQKRMWRLLEILGSTKLLKERLFGVEFLASTNDEVLVTLLYHKPLTKEWEDEARGLESMLDISLIARSRKQKIIFSKEYITQQSTIDSRPITYRQYEGGFTQPNPFVNIKMIEWAIAQIETIEEGLRGDFLESYCGLGNFTIPLSYYFHRVLATEISKSSIKAALENCEIGGITNIDFIRLSSEEMTEALGGEREFVRLRGVDLERYDFGVVLVDPPRAGLDSATKRLISDYQHIIYISCNPETLAHDLATLTLTHEVKGRALFDQFPHTHHMESGVFLVKKSIDV